MKILHNEGNFLGGEKMDSKKISMSAVYVFAVSVGQLEAVPILHFPVNHKNLCTYNCIMNHCLCVV